MRYDLAIFDLDGTVLNTLDDLADACNQTMRHFNCPTHTTDEVRRMVGGGVGKLIRRALPADKTEAEWKTALEWFREYYASHAEIKTAPYPEILEMLTSLRAAGMHIACNSNKFDSAVRALCEKYLSPHIELAMGERDDVPRKPAPDAANAILAHFGTDKSRAIYIGDSDVDLQTAKNAGIDCAWVSWGFRRRNELGECVPPHAFDTPAALGTFLLEE